MKVRKMEMDKDRDLTLTELAEEIKKYLEIFHNEPLLWVKDREQCDCDPDKLGKEKFCKKCTSLKFLSAFVYDEQVNL